jgi:tRNA(adenine34) deaminase
MPHLVNMNMLKEHDVRFMRLALEQAEKARAEGEVPVGAILIMGRDVLAAVHNKPVSLNDPSAHAEMLAMRKAAERSGNYRLIGSTLYVTLEPCIMCAGAIIQARVSRIVYGADDPKSGAVESLYSILSDRRLNHTVEVTGGILKAECSEILSRFFREKRITSEKLCGEIPKWS